MRFFVFQCVVWDGLCCTGVAASWGGCLYLGLVLPVVVFCEVFFDAKVLFVFRGGYLFLGLALGPD